MLCVSVWWSVVMCDGVLTLNGNGRDDGVMYITA